MLLRTSKHFCIIRNVSSLLLKSVDDAFEFSIRTQLLVDFLFHLEIWFPPRCPFRLHQIGIFLEMINNPTKALSVNPFSSKDRKCGLVGRSSLLRLNLILTKFLNNLVEIELNFAFLKFVSPIVCEVWLDVVDRVYEVTNWLVPVRIWDFESFAVVVRFLLIPKLG